MSAFRLGLCFALALVVALVVGFPLRLALGSSAPEGFSAERVRGSVWAGVAEGAQVGGVSLGDLRLGLDPLGVVSGGLGLRFSSSGALAAQGVARFGGGGWSVEDLGGDAPIAALATGAPLEGSVIVDGVRVRFARGRCLEARGDISTDALTRSGAALSWRGPELAGAFACAEDGSALAEMTGEDGRAAAAVTLKLFGDGRVSLETKILPKDDALAQVLPLAGFAPGPQGFSRLDEGRFGL